MNQTGTVGNQRVIAGLSMDENSRIDENEQNYVSLRTTDATLGLGPSSVCVHMCTPCHQISLPPPPSKTPYPPNRRVAGCHLGHLGSRGRGGGVSDVGKLA